MCDPTIFIAKKKKRVILFVYIVFVLNYLDFSRAIAVCQQVVTENTNTSCSLNKLSVAIIDGS